MKPFRLNRRALLRGSGGVAIALPWLEIMEPERASAAPASARRFVTVYTPGGTILDQWRPTGDETDFTLSPILAPLEPVKDRMLVLDGIDMKSAVGEQNQSGMIALLTGTAQSVTSRYATGPSIDQVLAGRLSTDAHRLRSLELAVRWGTGKAAGMVSPIDIISYADTASFEPVKPLLDPIAVWQDLFGGFADEAAWDRSILDAVGRRYQALSARLGSEDRLRLDAHLTRIRELEQRLGAGTGCFPPELVSTEGYDPRAGLESSDDGSVRAPETDAAIPVVGKLMMDMLVMALACDITTVASLMWTDCESKHTFPWLNLLEHYAYYQNDGGFHPIECATIQTWYQGQHAYLIEQMARVDMGGHSLLDESVVLIGSHLQDPATHMKNDMPFLLAGSGGGMRTGRYLRYDHPSHNDLLVALFNLCGDMRTSFGDAVSGPLPNLV